MHLAERDDYASHRRLVDTVAYLQSPMELAAFLFTVLRLDEELCSRIDTSGQCRRGRGEW